MRYPYIRALRKIPRSHQYYIDRQVVEAIEEKAQKG